MKQGLASLSLLVLSSGLAWSQPAPGAAPMPAPMTVLSQSSEYRFQMDFHVNDAALAKMLPAGWASNAATQGAAKDANVRLIFIDAGNVVGPDNKLLGKGADLLVYLAAPVKQAAGPGNGQMVLAGIAQNDTAAAFGVMDKASTAKVSRSIATANGATQVTEDWDFAAANGEHASLHVKYTRAPANLGGGAANFYNPADPSAVQIFKTQQTTDVTRNVTTTPPDRVTEFSYKAGGGKLASLFDGTEKPLSWDSQPIYNRVVGTPVKP
jgi:hypothetical protein